MPGADHVAPLSCDHENCRYEFFVRMFITIVPFGNCAAWHSFPPPLVWSSIGELSFHADVLNVFMSALMSACEPQFPLLM